MSKLYMKLQKKARKKRKETALFLVHSFSFCKFWKSESLNIIFNNYAFYHCDLEYEVLDFISWEVC